MGVSGTGKSTVGRLLADRLGADFLEGDAFHPERNIAKMSAGQPLSDDDRWPWLAALADLVADREAEGRPAVLTCSALRRAYRDFLRNAVPSGRLVFLHLHADADVLEQRMRDREGHFMPASLLASQLATLEPLGPEEPGVLVEVSADVATVVAEALAALAGRV